VDRARVEFYWEDPRGNDPQEFVHRWLKQRFTLEAEYLPKAIPVGRLHCERTARILEETLTGSERRGHKVESLHAHSAVAASQKRAFLDFLVKHASISSSSAFGC